MQLYKVSVLCVGITAMACAIGKPGDLDMTFSGQGKTTIPLDPGANRAADSLIAPDGKIYLVGSGADADHHRGIAITRHQVNGQLDLNYGNTQPGRTLFTDLFNDYFPVAAALQPDGKLLVVATEWTKEATNLNVVVCRFDTSGFPDPTFKGSPQGDDFGFHDPAGCSSTIGINNASHPLQPDAAVAIAVQSDGKILIASSAGIDGKTVGAVSRLLANGTPDGIYGMPPISQVNAGFFIIQPSTGFDAISLSDIKVNSDGGTLVAASTRRTNTKNWDFTVARFTSLGDPKVFSATMKNRIVIPFDQGGNKIDLARRLQVLGNGSFIIAGDIEASGGTTVFAATKLLSTGALDAFWNNGKLVTSPACDVCTESKLADMAVQADGKIVLAGTQKGPLLSDVMATRVTPNGKVDDTFGFSGTMFVNFGLTKNEMVVGDSMDAGTSVNIQNGKIIIAGTAQVDPDNLSNLDFAVMRLLAN